MTDHPYVALPDRNFWMRTMAAGSLHSINPEDQTERPILPSDRLMTLGSCFAQHISRHLARHGNSFLVTEPGAPDLTEQIRKDRGYGVFTARYGNVYTVRQALQLLRRSFDQIESCGDLWLDDEKVVDPHRPTIEPEGFGSIADLNDDRTRHLAATRQAFTEADVLVFTLGLTEAWRSKETGLVFPLAPGVSGGEFDASIHEFVNFSFSETISDLMQFIRELRGVNPLIRVILTVSPVPLAATFEPRHVLVSTAASKAILRAAADQAARDLEDVSYFPSYEIITAPGFSDRYFEDDLRSVRSCGVEHVMRVFKSAYMDAHKTAANTEQETKSKFQHDSLERSDVEAVICDEDQLL